MNVNYKHTKCKFRLKNFSILSFFCCCQNWFKSYHICITGSKFQFLLIRRFIVLNSENDSVWSKGCIIPQYLICGIDKWLSTWKPLNVIIDPCPNLSGGLRKRRRKGRLIMNLIPQKNAICYCFTDIHMLKISNLSIFHYIYFFVTYTLPVLDEFM